MAMDPAEIPAVGVREFGLVGFILSAVFALVYYLLREMRAQREHASQEHKEAREAFVLEQRESRQMFAEQLGDQRTQSVSLAKEGHAAVSDMASSVRELAAEVHRLVEQGQRDNGH